MKKIMIFGAASAIAQETAKCFARDTWDLYLVDIKKERCQVVKDDILTKAGYAKIEVDELDANDFGKHEELIQRAINSLGGIDAVLIAHGTLPNQEAIQNNPEQILKEYSTNCLSVISLSTVATNYFEKQGSGTLAVISSVAGDRGRQSNYIYGSAKGAVSLFLQGLRNRLNKKGIKIITIKPGMVDTPMTAGMPKGPLFSQPSVIGEGIYKAMISGKDIAYLPKFWWLVMWVIKHIPETIFKKLSL
jgi:decaprenylphospho-beta-D-erythro-pentofuranosid-2-ulose 2-reductase